MAHTTVISNPDSIVFQCRDNRSISWSIAWFNSSSDGLEVFLSPCTKNNSKVLIIKDN